MDKLIIKNGIVFDPINNIEGEVMDILIQETKIVEKFSNEQNIKEVDAKGKTVIPAALDIHTHIASQQLNWARLLGSNSKKFQEKWKGLTLERIVRSYISNGYTFVLEANVFPSLAKQTIFNFKQTPVLDKAMLLNVSNFWPLELEFQRGKIEETAVFLSDLLQKTKGFGIKAYNPFESENWNFNIVRDDLTAKGRLYNFTALNVYENLTKCVEYLGLPHSLHAHIEGYEQNQGKSNLITVLNRIKSLGSNLNRNRNTIFHIAHASAYNVDGDNSKLIEFINNNPEFDLDLAFIGFDSISPLFTSDRRLINILFNSNLNDNNQNLIRSAVESEGDSFVALRKFDRMKEHDCILWANSIDLALNIKNKWQIQLSFNFPNYSDINNLPEIATLLMSKKARDLYMEEMNNEFLNKSVLKYNDTQLTFNDFIIFSRSSPAKSLGLSHIKGNFAIGSDADLNILDINVNEVDLSKDYQKLSNVLSNIVYVIKAGKIVKNKDLFNLQPNGHIFWSKGEIENKEEHLILKKKKEFYQKFSSIFYDSYNITIDKKYLKQI